MTRTLTRNASYFDPRDPVELVIGYLLGDVVLLVGKKGTGKSQIIAHWIACIIAGKEFVPGVAACVRGEAVIFHGERSIESTLVPRLIAAGVSNLKKVHLPRVDTLQAAAEKLQQLVEEHPKIKIVVVDPLNSFVDGKSPTNAKARKLLKPVLAVCERHGICVVLVHHFTKGTRNDLIDSIGGSSGWSQTACSIWATAKIKGGCLLQHVECNDLPIEGQCFEYAIEPATLDPDKFPSRTRPTSRVVMLGNAQVDIATALRLGREMAISSVPNAMLQIEQLLKRQGPKPSVDVIKHLTEQGVTRATWKRAQDSLHKQGRLEYIAKGRTTSWRWIGAESESQSKDNNDLWSLDSDE